MSGEWIEVPEWGLPSESLDFEGDVAPAVHLPNSTLLEARHPNGPPTQPINKNLATANRSRVSCAHNTSRASIGLITHDLEI